MSTWKVVPGTTVALTYQWGAPPLTYVNATVSNLTPLRLTATSHGIPDGWAVAIADLSYLTELQAETWPPTNCDFRIVRVPDANTIEFNQLDANRINAGALNSTGTLAYETPVDMTGFTGSFTYVFGLLAVVQSVTIDNTAKTITATLAASDTAEFIIGDTYEFELLMTSSLGVVTQLDAGVIEVVDGTGC